MRSVGGVALTRGFANEANGCLGEIAFADFLRCSSNQYAAELLVRSLEKDGFKSGGAGAAVPRAVLEKSAIATGLAEVFDVDASANRTSGRLALYWNPDSASVPGASAAMSDRSLIPYESRPWILFSDSGGTRVDLVARYAFGGWENRWTLLGLSQAYARIATGRNVQATFLHRAGASTAPRFPPATPRAQTAFAVVRSALVKVGESGTAAGLTDHLQDAIQLPVVVLAKTGTLNEGGPGGRLKTLAIAIGATASETSKGDTTALSCGLVAVTYFEFVDQENRKGPRVTLPRVHRDFAEGPLAAVLGRHWDRVSGCAPTAPAAGVPNAPPKAPARAARRIGKK